MGEDEDRKDGAGPGTPLRGTAAVDEIEARLRGLLGGLPDTLGKAIGAIRDVAERAEGAGDAQAPGSGTDASRGPLRTHLSVRVGGLAGRTGATEETRRPGTRDPATPVAAASARPGRAPAREPMAEPREPVLESHLEEGAWSLIAELPGASSQDVDIAVGGGRLRLSTRGPRRYAAELDVPPWLSEELIRRSFVNGILELRAEMPGGGPDGGNR